MSDEETRERLMRLEMFTGVDDPKSGLRAEVRETREDVRAIYERIRMMELRLYTIAGGVGVAAWALSNLM